MHATCPLYHMAHDALRDPDNCVRLLKVPRVIHLGCYSLFTCSEHGVADLPENLANIWFYRKSVQFSH